MANYFDKSEHQQIECTCFEMSHSVFSRPICECCRSNTNENSVKTMKKIPSNELSVRDKCQCSHKYLFE